MSIKDTGIYIWARRMVYLLTIHPRELTGEKKRREGDLGRFESLRAFKGIHCGKRCFIVATGPSLTEDDYSKIQNEYTIGVNGLCLWFNDKVDETKYFVVSDDDVYSRIEEKLKSLSKSHVFVSERVGLTQDVDKRFHVFPVDIWNRFAVSRKKRLSHDISICSYDEETVVFHAIQLALYLGFSEIYLLGTDCNYTQQKKYAVDHGKQVDPSVGNKMIQSYVVVKNYEDRLGFRVYNATRGGMLEVFPRVDLDEVL